MIDVFITDIQTKVQADGLSRIFENENADLKIDFDLNETELPFPCGHTILRVEGDKFNSEKLIATVRNEGYNCEILEDKICIKKKNYDRVLGRSI